jgi:hypothetical protein
MAAATRASAETVWAGCKAGVAGAGDRARSGVERRAGTTVVISSIWGPVASSPESHRLGRYPMTTIPSAAIVVYDLELAGPEHIALGGYRAHPRRLCAESSSVRLLLR